MMQFLAPFLFPLSVGPREVPEVPINQLPSHLCFGNVNQVLQAAVSKMSHEKLDMT